MGKKVLVIGGGAAGFFAAINIAEKQPGTAVTILEKSPKTLQKVKISGGGRCNVTNARQKPGDLVKFYPRGGKKLYKIFERFGTTDMVAWLAKRGVDTVAEADMRMFPVSNDSQTIIDCFYREIRRLDIGLSVGEGVESITQQPDQTWEVITTQGKSYVANAVVITTGSSPAFWEKIGVLGIKINPPVPSLFTFNIKDDRLLTLPGVSFPAAHVKIAGSKLDEVGPLLITHWGLSGPAVLKLSAWGAREFEAVGYKFTLIVNFLGDRKFEEVRLELQLAKDQHPTRKVINYPVEGVPKRYWENILSIMEVSASQVYGELTKKQVNKLAEELCQAQFQVDGKSTFKEEFVTCGGVDLSEIDLNTMQAARFPNLYFAGEVLDIDALTGGFNFQACWTTAWIVSESV